MIIDWAIYYQQNKHLPYTTIMEGYKKHLREYQELMAHVTQINQAPGAGPAAPPEPDVTPSITPTPSVTPSVTPSLTPTKTVTPSLTATPSVTPSLTATPSITPSTSQP